MLHLDWSKAAQKLEWRPVLSLRGGNIHDNELVSSLSGGEAPANSALSK